MAKHGSILLTSHQMAVAIQSLTPTKHLWVAYSGGLDSHVLLDLTVQAFANHPDYQVGAVHVHHGLSVHADDWVQHCEAVCAGLQVPLTVLWVDAAAQDGQSPEEAARDARLLAWKNFLRKDECLILAHHGSDQAETILLRLFRGAGPLGLSGMLEKTEFGEGELIRPLLQIPKEEINAYAHQRQLHWIEDESNQNTRFDRNFLRHEVLPLLVARWPRVLRSVTRSGELCLETSTAIQVLSANDLLGVKGKSDSTLSTAGLLKLEEARRRGVIRLWLQMQGYSLPSRDHMERIDREVLKAKPGAKPRLKISDYEIRRMKDDLCVEAVV